MEIHLASEEEKNQWDNIVNSSCQATIFHTWNWLKIIEKYSYIKLAGLKVYGKLHPIMVYDDKKLSGIWPVYLFKHQLLKMIFSPPEYTGALYLGPIMPETPNMKYHTQQDQYQKFISTCNRYCRDTLRSNYINASTAPGFFDYRPFTWDDFTCTPKFTYILDLKKGEKAVWDGFTSKLRNNIKKGEKIGITVRKGGKEEYIHILNMLKSRIETYNRPNNFFDNVFSEALHGQINVFVAEKEGKILSGINLLPFHDKISAWIGTPRSEQEGISPNELLYWECIKWAISTRYKYFEIMGADDSTLVPFKRKFNGELQYYFNIRWLSPMFRRIMGIYKGYY